MRFLDSCVLVVGVIGPLTTIPQILLIYTTHMAVGVSALSWFGPAVLDIPWILYGIAHREKAIVITYSLWLVMNTAVAVGAVLYH
jgi:hypothetical protein